MITGSNTIPRVSPLLLRFVAVFSAMAILLSYIANIKYGLFIDDFLRDDGGTLYLALAGIAATLTGFIIAGIAIVSTVLSKPDFSRSPLKRYYNQVYNSFKSSVIILIFVMVFGILLAIFPKDTVISAGAFYAILYLFFSALILMWYSVDLIGNILSADSEGAVSGLHDNDISHTDLPTSEDGSLYQNDETLN